MSTLPTHLVGDAYESTHHWNLLCDLVDIDNRMAGQDGETEAVEVLADAFERHGLREIKVTEFDIPGWWRGSSSLAAEFGEHEYAFENDYQVIALPGTPSGDLAAELVDVGYGRPEDFEAADCEGKIVMASSRTPDSYGRWIHRMEKYGFAANHGAIGFVFRNHVEGTLPPTGSIGNADGPGAIPAIGISKEVGARLVRYCEEEIVDATLVVDCRNEPTTSRNIEAVIGPDTDEEVLVTGHVDAHDIAEGANDNGVGSVLSAEVGRLLAQIEDEIETTVRCLVFGSEEVGLFGAYHWVDTHPNKEVKAIVNMDGVGYSRDLAVHTHRFDGLGTVFEEISQEYAIPIEVSESIRPHSDHWPFVQEGIPGVQARSLSGESGRGWGHTHADTLDKLDPRDLRDLSVPITAATLKIAEADRELPSKPVSEIREATIEDDLEEGMRNSSGWPFDAQ